MNESASRALAHYASSQACNGIEALEVMRAERPDLVLTDLHMPEMDGLELTKAIRDEYGGLPVGLVTSDPNEALRDEAIENGARFIVTKPFSANSLGRQLEGLA